MARGMTVLLLFIRGSDLQDSELEIEIEIRDSRSGIQNPAFKIRDAKTGTQNPALKDWHSKPGIQNLVPQIQ